MYLILYTLIFILFIDYNIRCMAIKSKLAFYDSPLSEEERDYPLAYGALVFKNAAQVLFWRV